MPNQGRGNRPLKIRLTPDEWRAVEYLARELEMDHSKLVRTALARLAEEMAVATAAAKSANDTKSI